MVAEAAAAEGGNAKGAGTLVAGVVGSVLLKLVVPKLAAWPT